MNQYHAEFAYSQDEHDAFESGCNAIKSVLGAAIVHAKGLFTTIPQAAADRMKEELRVKLSSNIRDPNAVAPAPVALSDKVLVASSDTNSLWSTLRQQWESPYVSAAAVVVQEPTLTMISNLQLTMDDPDDDEGNGEEAENAE